jgi:hypothetical protein
VRGRQRAVARSGALASLILRLVVHVIGVARRSCDHAPPVTHRAPATTRRPPLPSSASYGHGDTARHDPQAHRLRARSSPAQRSASRCRGGAGRWPIRWAKRCRIGPYQAQRRAPTVATSWADLQAFGAWQSCERHASHARGRWFETSRAHPKRCWFAGTSSASPCGRATAETRRFVPHQSDRSLRTADERIYRASSRLTRERSPVRTQPRPASSSDKSSGTAPTWNAARQRGCRVSTDAGAPRGPIARPRTSAGRPFRSSGDGRRRRSQRHW